MQRLKTRTQFQAVMAGGTLVRTAHFALHRLMLNPLEITVGVTPLFEMCDVWMGAMVPKRWAKRAVTRNAIKRQIYNVGCLVQPTLKPAAHVVRLRAGFDKATFPSATSDALKATVRQELVQLFARAGAASQASPLALARDLAQKQ